MWRQVSPSGAIGDLIAVFRDAGHLRWRFAALAVLATWGIFTLITREEQRIPPRLPKVTYITAWHAGRSDAEIVAGNVANEQVKERLAAEQAQRDEKVKGIYKAIGRASGMDVDAIDRQAQRDAQADATAQAARDQALLRPAAHR